MKRILEISCENYTVLLNKHMEFDIELLDRIIKNAESLNALSMSVEVGEHKGWTVRVSIEKPNSELDDFHKF